MLLFNDFEMVLPYISQVYSSSGNVRKSLLSGVHELFAYDSPLNKHRMHARQTDATV